MTYRVECAITVDLSADNSDQAEIMAYEYFDLPGMEVISVTPLEEIDGPH